MNFLHLSQIIKKLQNKTILFRKKSSQVGLRIPFSSDYFIMIKRLNVRLGLFSTEVVDESLIPISLPVHDIDKSIELIPVVAVDKRLPIVSFYEKVVMNMSEDKL